mmetsp:Transcript_40426/g.121806  ORF Transcript_40426/g.121806 Transcript_40426/m.121806 type:complete len:153 (-) Transcript_40426:1272-1730(-)
MKLALTSALLVASASAFAPSATFVRPSVALSNARVDSADAVNAAMEASEKFGKTSPEARSAWDIVEEMDASDNSEAVKPAGEAIPAVTPISMEEKDASATISSESVSVQEAIAEAKRITEEKGISSPEARVAWETVEEIGATESHHKSTGQG